MPPSPTELLNDDIKELKADSREIRSSIDVLKADIHRIDINVAELGVQIKGVLSAIRLLAVLAITSLAASIWWGATLTSDLKNLGVRMDERFRTVEARLNKMDARFDRLEASIGKVLEQTRPASPKTQ